MNAYLDIILRTAVVYLFMVVAIRFFGKKELAQLSTTDLVFIILISNSVQNAMVGDNSSLPGGILAAFVLFSLNHLMKRWMYRSKRIKELVEAKPVILIHDGKIYEQQLIKEQISEEELEQAIREHGIESYKQVKLAILEVDGNISILSKDNGHLKQTHFKRRRKHKTITPSQ